MTMMVPTETGPLANEWTDDEVSVLKNSVARGLTDPELRYFAMVCQRTGLDPFRKQIYAIKRPQWNPDTRTMEDRLVIQTGIDGYRAIAVRSGLYDGQDPPQWCGRDGMWVDVWTSDEPPFAARQTVYRKGARVGLTAVARHCAYVQTKKNKNGDVEPNTMWTKMGPEQLVKCAEALALRKAFPEDLSGLYTTEEMGQANNDRDASETEPAPPPQATVLTPEDKKEAIAMYEAIANHSMVTREVLRRTIRELRKDARLAPVERKDIEVILTMRGEELKKEEESRESAARAPEMVGEP